MNKQIEEIARTCPYNVRGRCGLDETICTTDCEVAKWGCEKASDVAREVMQEVRQALLNMVLANSMGETYDIEKRFAEIEKKYESEGADDGLE